MSTESEILERAAVKKSVPASKKNPYWYKSGIIYELHVRSFQDGNDDGIGDFKGLTARLDYLRDLGITAIWLLPFYPSPLKDDGYDISDYFNVHPMYGTLADFKSFLSEAHRRNLRVITELVMNHTSDQHPWFQRARLSPPNSKYRNYYVWSETTKKYQEARIIFKDTEFSNWTWDAAANAFYWHRFFLHQPDLNFESAEVQEEVMKILDYWFDLGVDGVRLDAVPYLYERDGTSCENLPETHEFLKKVRKHVDEKYGDRMLLAEANQWPEDAVAYFGSGKGDECHMAFHFPLMPRLFMSLRMEDRVPIVDIMQQTPPIPETAQWALFLRNHDELTLEMVTDEERDYMYRMYANLDQARLNLGIRRRLAPLVGNDRKRIELLTALLFSLPGTPVIYYGDEIGMGDNVFLGDRNGVRTPMQWSADKNAGFSRANPQSLFLPINLDPENHYEAVNVETQDRNNHSLLWWTRRLISLYKRQKAFGAGMVEFLHPENRKIFASIRRYDNEIILVVANLSRFVQPVEMDLAAYQSLVPIELFGRTEFPAITDKPYFLTLGPHAFYWFSLEAKIPAGTESTAPPASAQTQPLLTVFEDWAEIFDEPHRFQFERVLQNWLPTRRWFGGKTRTIKSVRTDEVIQVPVGAEKAFVAFLHIEYVQSDPDTYILPLMCASGDNGQNIARDFAPLIIARLNFEPANQTAVLYDAMASKDYCRVLLDKISHQQTVEGKSGRFETTCVLEPDKFLAETGGALEPVIAKAEQGNSSIVYGDKLILKLFRRIEAGINPDLEISQFLTAQKFPHSPPLAGAVEYRFGKNGLSTVAILSSFVPKAKDAWEYTLDTLGKFYDRVQTLPEERRSPQIPGANIAKLAVSELSEPARSLFDAYLESTVMLGQRTAAMHLALAADTENRNFAPEPFTPHAQRGLFQSLRNLMRQNFQFLNRQLKKLPPEVQPHAQSVLALEPEILQRFRQIYGHHINASLIRLHGNFHLGQVLYTGKDFQIIDFKGEPTTSISERRLKRSALQDVAGMIRSFHYAAYTALLKQIERGTLPHAQIEQMILWSRFWARWISAVYYQAYLQAAAGAVFLPSELSDRQMMMEIFLLRKAIFELGFELANRPDRAKIPLQGILELINE